MHAPSGFFVCFFFSSSSSRPCPPAGRAGKGALSYDVMVFIVRHRYSFSMALKLYNTYSKKEELFVPHDPKLITMYTCGPTVYGRPHIGNYSSFLEYVLRSEEH